jgi:murein DD-endopeptidase MepM/ murein hydrolase activator NlpD
VIKAASLHLSGKMLAVVRDVTKDGSVRYFDEKGEMPTKAFLRYPVKYTRISSVFTHARFHPVLKITRPHNGVDFAAPIGTPVRSVGDGVVVHSGYSPSGGNMVRILHDSRYTTEYMHLNSITKNAKKGARIGRGETLGTLGNTGLSSGPHLHYGLFDRGKYIDPMKAKVVLSSESGKPPAAVLAMIVELKKSHQGVAVASKRAGKNA